MGQASLRKSNSQDWEGERGDREQRAGGQGWGASLGFDGGAGRDATGPAREKRPRPLSPHRRQPLDHGPARSGTRSQRVLGHPQTGLGEEVAGTRSLVVRAEPPSPALPTVQSPEGEGGV